MPRSWLTTSSIADWKSASVLRSSLDELLFVIRAATLATSAENSFCAALTALT